MTRVVLRLALPAMCLIALAGADFGRHPYLVTAGWLIAVAAGGALIAVWLRGRKAWRPRAVRAVLQL